jgi:hypothetical protein
MFFALVPCMRQCEELREKKHTFRLHDAIISCLISINTFIRTSYMNTGDLSLSMLVKARKNLSSITSPTTLCYNIDNIVLSLKVLFLVPHSENPNTCEVFCNIKYAQSENCKYQVTATFILIK